MTGNVKLGSTTKATNEGQVLHEGLSHSTAPKAESQR